MTVIINQFLKALRQREPGKLGQILFKGLSPGLCSVTRRQATAGPCLPGRTGAPTSPYVTKLSKAICGKERWNEVNI